MNNKILRQIENMKKQTFGVEIEMAEIKRKRAIEVVAKCLGRPNTVRYEGGCYYAWSCKDKQNRKWRIMNDASIVSTEENAELVTPILNYNDMEILQEITRELRRAGAISNPKHGCGVHIHVGAKGDTPKTLKNLVNIMASHERLVKESLKLDNRRVRRFCKMINPTFLKNINKKSPKTMSELAEI